MKSKKFFGIFAALLAFAFVAGTVVEAQELKFDGYVNSGLGFVFSDQEDDDARIMVYGVDSERNIGRFRLNGAFTNENKNAGANFRIQVQGRGASDERPANALSLAFGYGWVKPIDMLTIKAGLVDDGTFQTADFYFNGDQDEGVGVLARLTPMTGLDFGFGAYVASYSGGGDNNFLPRIDTGMKLADAKYTLNFAYTMDKTFRLMASYRLENEAQNGGNQQLLAELRLLMVPNLTAVVTGQFDRFGGDTFDDNGKINFFETFGYKMGDISFGLNAGQYIDNSKDDMSIQLNPWVSISMNEGKVVPRLDVVYLMNGTFAASAAGLSNYHRKALSANNTTDASVINARPSVKINLDSRNALEIGDAFYYYTPASGDAAITNVFYLDFVTRF